MPVSASTYRLRLRYAEIRSQGYLAGSSLFYELQRLAVKCTKELQGTEQLLCVRLSEIFERIAKSQDGQAVTAEEGARLSDILDQPIANCIDYLCGRTASQSARDIDEKLAAALLEAFLHPKEEPGA